ncbi:MAG: alpha-mannosidase [Phycisphaerales bacterium JB043]
MQYARTPARVSILLLSLLIRTHASGQDAIPSPENAAQRLTRSDTPARDLSDPSQRALYAVAYAHLDTQWRWDFVTTIDEYIRSTLVDNFELLDAHPEYVFNFTGSVRYEMMREYYPELYERLKEYIARGRWHVSGSSVDEGDVNVPSPESIIRQVLYGNLFFEREFGKTSNDFMLPDCFGFPASLPSIWAHCGLLGFSTQKLTWGSAVGIPFEIGIWEGPNGDSIIAALDPGPYVGAIEGRVDTNQQWAQRIEDNGTLFGVWADYHYYGTGDQGGAPAQDAVANYSSSSTRTDGLFDLVLGSSGSMYEDITPEQRARLPRYKGDMLLTEHSAGTLTSQSYMKRWNRQAEQLADSAERAATMAWATAGDPYPREKLERSWVRVLANQMHDILPGTSIPRAYRYSWNDEIVAMNGFADVLTRAIGAASAQLDTRVEGTPLVVFNPLTIARQDVVEATVEMANARHVRVFDARGNEVPSQQLARDGSAISILFLASVEPNSLTVFDVRSSDSPFDDQNGPMVGPSYIENERYKVELNSAGDIERIYDKREQEEILSSPSQLVFTHETPRSWPAWNMDWADRIKEPLGVVDGTPVVRIVERGPIRARLEITRQARNSRFIQQIVLARQGAGHIVEVDNEIDWQSSGVALRASFPLSISNPNATYNWGLGTIERGNIEPKRYEVPSHGWFNLTDTSDDYSVTILEDSKFGSDKPTDDMLRLTLLYSPGVRNWYMDQHSQDWGLHEMRYAVAGHAGDWRDARAEWLARRFNQPLRAFSVPQHDGPLGRSFSLASSSTPQIDIRAIKLSERRDSVIIRVQELWGQNAQDARINLSTDALSAHEVDGQERRLAPAQLDGNSIVLEMSPYAIRSFEIELEPRQAPDANETILHVDLPFNIDVFSTDDNRNDGSMDMLGRTYPAEMLPDTIHDHGVSFTLESTDPSEPNALEARGQSIVLSDGDWDTLHLLVAAQDDIDTTIGLGSVQHNAHVQSWTGFVGQWDDRVWDRKFPKVDHKGEGRVTAIVPGFVKRAPITWFATHRHDTDRGNEAYTFSYIYRLSIPRVGSARTLHLPHDERLRVFAATLAHSATRTASPASPLYDTLEGRSVIPLRHSYDIEETRIFTGIEPLAMTTSDRERRFELLSIGAPNEHDDLAPEARFVGVDPSGRFPPHHMSGVQDGVLVRLNDTLVGANHDDTSRSVWYDNEGRFTLDLGSPQRVRAIRTYSWHRANRAPQLLSVWGSSTQEMPDPSFRTASDSDWELLGVVDTRSLGDGDIHASLIGSREGESLPPFRHLLWIMEDVGEGTFLQEIDIELEDAP